jgi:hypothetical protein
MTCYDLSKSFVCESEFMYDNFDGVDFIAPVRLYVDLSALYNVMKQLAGLDKECTMKVSEGKKTIKFLLQLEDNNTTKITLSTYDIHQEFPRFEFSDTRHGTVIFTDYRIPRTLFSDISSCKDDSSTIEIHMNNDRSDFFKMIRTDMDTGVMC